jgi:anthranilate phosphoribosyltransferase
VHGSDGLDELTTTGTTRVAELKGGAVSVFDVVPQDAGLPTATLAQLKGGDAEVNAAAIRAVLGGEPGPFRDIVLLNAAAALIVGGAAASLAEGAERAARAIDSGAAARALDKLIAVTKPRRSLNATVSLESAISGMAVRALHDAPVAATYRPNR